ncbi:beta-ketoacyl synthase N-terminal-like domain-containing protein [Actinomadura viridis]|uniref:beta-ketoacyl synthase N-terminal-like domain-containing protein n=1 Tax=Actinomadura viridis TaxID=58110 RepID=UPI00369E9612
MTAETGRDGTDGGTGAAGPASPLTGGGDRSPAGIIGIGPFGRPAPHLTVAVARAGGLGVLDLGTDRATALAALADVGRWWPGPFGIRVPAGCGVRPEEIPAEAGTVVIDAAALRPEAPPRAAARVSGRVSPDPGTARLVPGEGRGEGEAEDEGEDGGGSGEDWTVRVIPASARRALTATAGEAGGPDGHEGLVDVAAYARGRRLLIEVVDSAEAAEAVRRFGGSAGPRGVTLHGLIARGCEGGGRVGDLTTFVLLQRLLGDGRVNVPVWASGGIGPHGAAAAVAGGAAGVVLDAQLALVREMDLPADVAAAMAAMDCGRDGGTDGGGTRVVDGRRVYARPGLRPLPVGQDGALARPLAARYKTAGGVVQAFRAEIAEHIRAAVRARPLAPRDSPSGTGSTREYPVAQGPMTRVSDRSVFAAAIAQDGGLPFLALALMSGEEARELLIDTADRLGDRPWGVGVLGLAPPGLREAQLAAVREVRPPYAMLADGDPAEAASLEAVGIGTYLRVPEPGPLEGLLAGGARKFVFEGRESGGQVGPYGSLALWDAQVERLLAFCDAHPDAAGELSVMFAGGVHDERSAAMVAALAGPLAERGAGIRVLMGTAYLFTYEAVAAGAITEGFQRTAVECDRTVLLETAPGHATRCARTPYAAAFEDERRRLEKAGTPRPEARRLLEQLNLGRLRVATKGLRRGPGDPAPPGEHPEHAEHAEHAEHTEYPEHAGPGGLVKVDPAEQRREGMYMLGQVAALRSATTSITGLHEQVTTGATFFLSTRAVTLGLGGTGRAGFPAVAGPASADPVPSRPMDIAIVGMGCVFPGAPDAAAFWANVVRGVDAAGDVPAGRRDSEPTRAGHLPAAPFDALAHGVPPGSLGEIEPARLLALEVAARALEDAGYGDRPFDRSRTSVFFGAAAGTGRIADRLDLGGGGYTVDAASAGSLAALDAACKELVAGGSDMVLCGGADLIDGVHDHLPPAAGGELPPRGRRAPFDAAADGIAPAEGVACVVLKRLADAERDGDRVYAIIKSVAGAGDGPAPGPAAPRAVPSGAPPLVPPLDGRGRALDRAYRRARVSPSQVGLVEADGAGTGDGDRAELAALTAAFTGAGARPGGTVLGSVKSQIGHAGSAAGLAGLIKTARAVHAGVLPGTLRLDGPQPSWDPATSPFAFGGPAARPWAAAPGERVAGLSASGSGGAHFHAVLAGYDGAPEPVSGVAEWPAELFLIRGAGRAAARAELDRLGALLGSGPPAGRPRLRDLARTFAGGPGGHPGGAGSRGVQVALVATGPDDLAAKIAIAREFRAAPGVYIAAGDGTAAPEGPVEGPAEGPAEEPGAERGRIAFLYPGQGSQRPNMLAELFVAFPRLQRLLRLGGGRHTAAMFPPAAFTRQEAERQRLALADTRNGRPALAIAELALHRLLTELGVRPDLAAGHGHGELVALGAAGVFGEEDLIGLSAARAEADASADLRAELDARDLRSPAYPVWSCAGGAPHDTDPAELRAALAGQDADPNRFAEQIEAVYAAGARIFVETGPGRVLTGLVRRILGDRPHTAVAFDAPGEDGIESLLRGLAELAVAGVPVDPRPLFAGRDARDLSASGGPSRPGWIVDGHRVRTAGGGHLSGGRRPARPDVPECAPTAAPTAEETMETGEREPARSRSRLADQAAEGAVLEYLRASRELIAAQRDVVLNYLGAGPSATAQAATLTDAGPTEAAPTEAGHADAAPEPEVDRDGTPPPEAVPPVPGPRRALPGESVSAPGPASSVPVTDTGATNGADRTDGEDGTDGTGGEDGEAGEPGARPAREPRRPVRQVMRTTPLPRPPAPEAGARDFADRDFVIVDDGCGIALELAALLEAQGARVRTPLEPDGPCDGLVHLAALRPGGGPVLPDAYAGIGDALAGGLRWLVLAGGSGGTFGRRYDGGGVGDPTPGAGLRGLARTLALEFPEVVVRAVDVDTKDSPRAVALRILAEMTDAGAPVVVGHDGDARRTLTLVPAALRVPAVVANGDAEPALGLDEEGVVLLTGDPGYPGDPSDPGGITARLALELARTTGCHIELAVHAPEPPPGTGTDTDVAAPGTGGEAVLSHVMDELREHAASVRYHALDTRDARSVRALVEGVYARHGRLDGVIHGAGAAARAAAGAAAGGPAGDPDEGEHSVTDARDLFGRLYRAKVDGASALAAAVRPDLGFLVVLGGAAGVQGRRGGAAAAAADAAADDACETLARVWRTRLRGRVLVAGCDPGADSREGPPIDPDEAVAALLREIAYGDEVQVVFTGPAAGTARRDP